MPELGIVPGHVGVIPGNPGELSSIGRDAWRCDKIPTGDDRADFAPVQCDSYEFVGGFAWLTMVFSHTDQKLIVWRNIGIAPGKPTFRCQGSLSCPVELHCMETTVPVRGENDPLSSGGEGASAILMDAGADAAVGSEQFARFAIDATCHKRDATSFSGSGLRPEETIR